MKKISVKIDFYKVPSRIVTVEICDFQMYGPSLFPKKRKVGNQVLSLR